MKPSGMLAAMAVIVFLGMAVHGQDSRAVMVTEEWAPFRISGQNGEIRSGIDVDLMNEVTRRTGIAITIMNVPWSRCLEMIKLGQADILTGAAWTAERARAMGYVNVSYYSVRPVFYARAGSGGTVTSYEDLYGKSIGHSINSAYFERFNNDSKLNKIPLKDEETILKMLSLGRIDLVVGTEPNISWDIARLGMKGQFEPTTWQPGEKTPLYVVVSADSKVPNLADRLEKTLQAIMDDGTMTRILEKYR